MGPEGGDGTDDRRPEGEIVTQASSTPPYDPALEGTERDFKCLTCQLVTRAAYTPRACPRCGASRVKLIEQRAGAVVEEEEA